MKPPARSPEIAPATKPHTGQGFSQVGTVFHSKGERAGESAGLGKPSRTDRLFLVVRFFLLILPFRFVPGAEIHFPTIISLWQSSGCVMGLSILHDLTRKDREKDK